MYSATYENPLKCVFIEEIDTQNNHSVCRFDEVNLTKCFSMSVSVSTDFLSGIGIRQLAVSDKRFFRIPRAHILFDDTKSGEKARVVYLPYP